MNGLIPTFDLEKVRQAIAAGEVLRISPAAVNQGLGQGRDIVVVDVRDAEDFAKGHVPGAINLPPQQWADPSAIGKDKVAVVYCYNHSCPLGGAACAELSGRGYPVVEMDGGFDVWQSSEFDQES